MRIGVDLGGTKIEIITLNDNGATVLRRRVSSPPPAPRFSSCEGDVVADNVSGELFTLDSNLKSIKIDPDYN